MSATTDAPPVMTTSNTDASRVAAILPVNEQALRTIALAARIELLPAALLAMIAAFTDRPLQGGLVEAGTVVGALAVATLASISLYAAQPRLDLGATAIAMLLAGGQAIQGFGLVGEPYVSHAYALPIVAWLALFAGAVALALTIPVGVAERVNPLFARLQIGPNDGPAAAPAASGIGGASQAATPGWYPSPDGAGARWWDGKAWTDHKRDMSELGA